MCRHYQKKRVMNKKIISFILFFISTHAFSYVISKNETGGNLKWNTNAEDLVIYANPVPIGDKTDGISSSDVISILNESIAQWNSYTPFDLRTVYTTNIPSTKNKLYFTSNSSYFGSGVVAVTEINYNVETGSVASADIIINESAYNVLTFTKDETDSSYLKAYLGDVFTHELGHFLGLSHSEVIGSSMIYSIFKNQHTIHSDDYSGVLDIYNRTIYPGEFVGSVTGGGGNPVFGAHVMLLSAKDGKVVQSQLSEVDGSFHFKNLPLEESYYFYVAPVKQTSSVSSYYSTLGNAYCEQNSYQGSFFTKCGPRSQGRPQGFELNSWESSIDVGEITIRCDPNLDVNYLATKNESVNRSFELSSHLQSPSQVFVGMFSASEINLGTDGLGDEFLIDLSSIDYGDFDTNFLQLKLEFLAAGIGSAFDFEVKVSSDGVTYSTYNSGQDETGKTITDLTIALNLSNFDDKLYLKVFPIKLDTEQMYEIFSTASNLTNDISVYTINSQVGSYGSGVFEPIELYVADSYDDNSTCREANVEYITQAYTPLTATYSAAQDEINEGPIAGLSCATIDLDDSSGPGSGGMSFLIGFLFILMLSHFKQLTLISLSKS